MSDRDRTAVVQVRAEPPYDEDVNVLARQLVRAMFGAAALVSEVALRSLADSVPEPVAGLPRPRRSREAVGVVLGLAWQTASATDKALARGASRLAPAINFVLAPPLVPRQLTPLGALRQASSAWERGRPQAVQSLADWAHTLAPATSDVAVRLIDVDDLLAKALAQVKLQPLLEQVIAQLDVEDLLSEAISRVDLLRLVDRVLLDVDLTPVVERVMSQIDLEATVDHALTEIDVTAIVLQRVDLDRIIFSALEELDLTQLVLDRVDLVRVANHVFDGLQVPELIRESTRSIASETVDEVRLQSFDADRAVSRLVDRVLRRRGELR